MGFFKTSEGSLHGARIAGVLYVISLLPGCHYFQHVDLLCVMRIASTAAWWLAFCDRVQPRTLADLIRPPHRALGTFLLIAGLIGQFYAVGR